MTAPLPQGLIRVVSATHTEAPSDPTDALYERKRALHNFWKVHDAQSRATRDVSNIRCRQLFWRVWGNERLSTSLSQSTMLRLWIQCQRGINLSSFNLQNEPVRSCIGVDTYQASESIQRRLSKDSQASNSSSTASPPQVVQTGESSTSSSKQRQHAGAPSQTAPRPGLARTSSGDASRKCTGVASASGRGRTRPTIQRKRSSQPAQSSQIRDTMKTRRSVIKSPRVSDEKQASPEQSRDTRTSIAEPMQSIGSLDTDMNTGYPPRKISAFELPSVSSWQSVDSRPDHLHTKTSIITPSPLVSPPLVEENFRLNFAETQKQLRSSTNFAVMNRVMRKTGSVVRFADEIDVPEEFRKLKDEDKIPTPGEVGGARRQELIRQLQLQGLERDKSAAEICKTRSTSPKPFHRAASEGQQPRAVGEAWQNDLSTQKQPLRRDREDGTVPDERGKLFHRDSTESVAAISDDGNEFDGQGLGSGSGTSSQFELPRTKSQLSLAISDLKRQRNRSSAAGSSFRAEHEGPIVTSPQIEEQQEALISGRAKKEKSEEEEKLLAMGRKDGVTRAGGVNLPKELRVAERKGFTMSNDDDWSSEDRPLYY